MRRIELLSEDPIAQVSPSAGCDLKFPRSGAHSRAQDLGSFMIPASPQSFGGPVPHINDAGDSSRERLRPTGGIKPRKQIRCCQLILIFRLLRGRKTRLASHPPGAPRRNQYTPMHYRLCSRIARAISRLLSRSAMASRLSCRCLPTQTPRFSFIRPSFRYTSRGIRV